MSKCLYVKHLKIQRKTR
jgi:hypothetical protein